MSPPTRRLRRLIRRAPHRFDTVTADNGSEFHDYAAVEATTGVTFYFATPYHSWERGTNENLNGLLRHYLPKHSNLAGLTQPHYDPIAHCLNTRPRKRLGYRTPKECCHEGWSLLRFKLEPGPLYEVAQRWPLLDAAPDSVQR